MKFLMNMNNKIIFSNEYLINFIIYFIGIFLIFKVASANPTEFINPKGAFIFITLASLFSIFVGYRISTFCKGKSMNQDITFTILSYFLAISLLISLLKQDFNETFFNNLIEFIGVTIAIGVVFSFFIMPSLFFGAKSTRVKKFFLRFK